MNLITSSKRLFALSMCLSLALLAGCSELDGLGLEAQIVSFTANPSSIEAGESATLSWNILGGPEDLEVSLMPGDVELEKTGSYQVTLQETTTYTLSVGSEGDITSKQTTLTVRTDDDIPAKLVCEDGAELVSFTDPELREAIKRNLNETGVEVGDEITCEEMASLTQINIERNPEAGLGPDGEVTDLTGLEYAVNLRELELVNVEAGLEPLAKLDRLKSITFGYFQPNDLTPLASVLSLESFYAYSITYASGASAPSLDSIKTLKSLKSVKVREDSRSSGTIDVSVFANLPKLTSLSLGDVYTENLQVISELVNLTELELINAGDVKVNNGSGGFTSDFELPNLTVLAKLTTLNKLNLQGSASTIKDFSVLANLVNLVDLSLLDTNIESLQPLANLNKLETLSLVGAKVSDLTPILNLPWSADDDLVNLSSQGRGADIPLIPAAQIEALEAKVATVLYDEEDVTDDNEPDFIGTFEFKPAQVAVGQTTEGYLNLNDSVDCSISVNGAEPYKVDCVGEISFTPRQVGTTEVRINAFKADGFHIFLTGGFTAFVNSGAVCATASDVIAFKDANFEKTIKAALNLGNDDVTCEQMASLKALTVSNGNFEFGPPYGTVKDISEIKYAVELEKLGLQFFEGDISSLAELPELELLELFVSDTGSSSLGPEKTILLI